MISDVREKGSLIEVYDANACAELFLIYLKGVNRLKNG